MTSKANRRDFIKTSAAFGAGLWVVGSGSGVLARTPNEDVSVAFIGVGGRGGSNLDELASAGANVVGLCDVDKGNLAGAAKKHTGAKTYSDFRKMLDDLDKSIDAVCVSTPDHTHTAAAVRAMRMGKHCYCEKPLTRTIGEARLMGRTARENKVATQMGNQGHSQDEARRTVEII
jgi:predicted dehydrogenase